jgi:hypothetical protein
MFISVEIGIICEDSILLVFGVRIVVGIVLEIIVGITVELLICFSISKDVGIVRTVVGIINVFVKEIILVL